MDPNEVPDYCIIKCSLPYDPPEPSLVQPREFTHYFWIEVTCAYSRYDCEIWFLVQCSWMWKVWKGKFILTAAPLGKGHKNDSLRVQQSQKESNTWQQKLNLSCGGHPQTVLESCGWGQRETYDSVQPILQLWAFCSRRKHHKYQKACGTLWKRGICTKPKGY